MRGHTETKKNEEKIEKKDRILRNILRNCLCVLAGIIILIIGIMAPKTIFAMMDKNEVDHIYVQQADTSYLDINAQMSMEEKLDLLDFNSTGSRVSSAYPVEDTDMYDDYDLQLQVASQVEEMQQAHLLPEFDFNILDVDAGTQYETLVNMENMNQYLMLVYMVFQVSEDYVYLSVDIETGRILGYTVYANMTEKEWKELLQADIVKYMADNLGVSEELIIKKYNYSVYNESNGQAYGINKNGTLTAYKTTENSETGADGKMFVQIGMWMKGSMDDPTGYYD